MSHRTFRIIKFVFLGLSILLCLAIPVVSLISTAINWHGSCSYAFTFTDNSPSCTWWESARYDMFFTSIFIIPFFFVTSSVWLSLAAAQFFTARKIRNKSGG